MTLGSCIRKRRVGCHLSLRTRGFTIIELMVVVGIVMLMATMAIPMIQSTMAFYDLQGAIQVVSGAVQATRFRAISDGVPYNVTFSSTGKTVQLSRCNNWNPTTPNTCAEQQVASVSIGSAAITLGSDSKIRLLPSGNATFVAGSSPITLSRRITSSQIKTVTITVTNYGSVKVQ